LSKLSFSSAHEKEAVLGEKFQTEDEKQALTDRHGLEFGWGCGYSMGDIMSGVYGVDRGVATYLCQLEMDSNV
jgi:hypothetical protein